MTSFRAGAVASTLLDGRVLIAGGASNGSSLASAEIYDGKSFTAVASMNEARTQFTAATLKDGRVVVIGGYATGNTPISSIEIYDPKANTWTEVPGGLAQARAEQTTTAMRDGRLLIAGGMGSSGILNTMEIYDPATNTCAPVSTALSSSRIGHAAALMPNGEVMLAGGFDGAKVLSSIDAYDPASNALSPAPQLTYARRDFTATALVDGRVLLAGGNDGTSEIAALEIVDLLGNKISLAGNLTVARSHPMVIALPDNGTVLIAGGTAAGSPVSTAELYSPVSATTRPAGSMSVARSGGTVSMLTIGGVEKVLVTGGESSGTSSTGDLYSFPTLRTDRPDYAPYTTVTVTGAGWAPGESVTLLFHENPAGDPDVTYTATADSSGSFKNTSFKPDLHDEGVTFLLTASGAQTGSTAQAAFNDSSYSTQITNPQPGSGTVGSTITVSANVTYGQPEYQNQYYYYTCDCYSCDCNWLGSDCGTCCSTCEGYNYVYVGTYWYPVGAGAPVQFYFDSGPQITGVTDSNGTATAQIVVPPGTSNLYAYFTGDGTFGAAESGTAFTAQASSTQVILQPVGTPPYGTITLSLAATLLTTSNTPVAGVTLEFLIDGVVKGSGTTNGGGAVSILANVSTMAPGNHSFQVAFGGAQYYYASSAQESFTSLPGLTKIIYFPPLTSPVTAGRAQTLSAAASNGDQVTYTVTAGTATISGNTVTFTTVGPVTIQANSAANSAYYAAAPVSQSVTVNSAPTFYVAPATAQAQSSSRQTAAVTFTTGGTLSAINVLTQGVTGLDFAPAAGGTCTVGSAYLAGQVCTVNYTFTPAIVGERNGAIVLYTTAAPSVPAGTSFISGTGTGALIGYTSSSQTTPAGAIVPVSGYANPDPYQMAIDGAGNIYFADNATHSIYEVAYTGGSYQAAVQVIAGYGYTSGIAIDGAGNLFYDDSHYGSIFEVINNNGTLNFSSPVAIGSGFYDENGLAVDAAGDVFVAVRNGSAAGGQVAEITPAGVQTQIASSGNGPFAVAVDGNNNVFYIEESTHNAYEIPYVGGAYTAPVLITSGTDLGLATDAGGNLWVGMSSGQLVEFPNLGGTTVSTTPVGGIPVSYPLSVTVAGNGNIFYTDGTNIRQINMAAAPAQSFPTIIAGTVTAPQSMTVANLGNLPLTISATFDPQFPDQGSNCVGTLAAGGTCAFTTAFTPPVAGPFTGALTVTDNAQNSAAQTSLETGTAIQMAQAITFTQPATPVVAGTTATLTATGGASGNPVVFSVTSGPGSVSGNMLSYTGAGTVVIAANQAGSVSYSAAPTVSYSVTVTAAPSAYSAPITPVGSTSVTQTAYVTFAVSGTLGSVNVLTKGAPGLDFVSAAGGNCAAGAAYAAGQVCSVNYMFDPLSAGSRFGAVVLTTSGGSVLGTSYVSGTGTGPLALFTTTTQAWDATGLGTPRGLSADGYGNVYVLETANGKVDKIAAGTNHVQTITTVAGTGSGGTAVDGAGNLFVAATGAKTIYEYVGGLLPAVAIVTNNCGNDDNIEADGAGNLYFTCYTSNGGAIYKVDAVTHALTQLLPGGFGHRFIALTVDAAGNVYTPDYNQNILYKLPAGSTGAASLQALVSGGALSSPHGIAVDPAGNIYVTNNTTGANVLRYAAGTYALTILPAAGEKGVTLDGSGNLFTIPSDSDVAEYSRTTAPSITFANTAVGATSNSSQSVELENDGNAPLAISSYAATGMFSLGGPTNTCAAGILASGATCQIGAVFTPTGVGAQTGSAVVTDNTQNVAGTLQTAPLSGTAVPATTSLSLSVPPTGLVGSPLTVSTTLSRVSAPAGTVAGAAILVTVTAPDGTVTTLNGTTDANGTTLVNFTPALRGVYNIAASYAGSAVLVGSTTTATPVTIYQKTALVLTPASGIAGNPLTLNAILTTVPGGIPVAGQAVNFSFNEVISGESAMTGPNGQATVSVVFPSAGSFPAQASFSNASGFFTDTIGELPSVPDVSSVSIAIAPAVTSLSLNAPSIIYIGSTLTVSSTLSRVSAPAGFVPGATILFTLTGPGGAITTMTGTTLANGMASVSFQPTVVGVYSIAASYAGSNALVASATATPVTIYQKTILLLASASGTAGGPITMTATLTTNPGGAPIAGQTVSFSFSGSPSPATLAAVTDVNGVAAATVNFPTAGAFTAQASFSNLSSFFVDPNGNQIPDTSSASVTVAPAVTSLSALTLPPVTFVGNTLTVSTTLSRISAPAGFVSGVPIFFTFMAPGGVATTLTGTTDAMGLASVNFTPTAGGVYSVAASFAATAAMTASSTTASGTVYQPTSLALAPASATAGSAMTLSATLTNLPGGAPLAGQTVNFSFSGPGAPAAQASTTDANGVATVSVAFAAAGTVTAQATFFNPSGFFADFTGAFPVIPDTASAPVTVYQANLSFGSQPVGTPTAAQTATFVFPGGSAGILAASVVTQGATGLDFQPGGTDTCSNQSISPGGTCSVSVVFNPLVPGLRLGAVVLTDNGAVSQTTYLGGTGTGPQGLFTQGTVSTAVAASGGVFDIVEDGLQNLYVNNSGTVTKIAAVTGNKTTLATNAKSGALGIDGAGNIYYNSNNSLVELVGGTSTAVTLATNLCFIDIGITVDAQGNFYLPCTDAAQQGYGQDRIIYLAAGSFARTDFGVGSLNHPIGVSVDASGNMYVSDNGNNRIAEITPANVVSTVASISSPGRSTFDAAGNLLVANLSSTITKFAPGFSSSTTISTGLGFSFAFALDPTGNLYVLSNAGQINLVSRTTATPLNFASAAYDSTSSEQTTGFENDGNEPLAISALAATANFNLTGDTTCATGSLAAASTCTLAVNFAPTTVGALTGTVNISDNTLNATTVQQASLTGTATQAAQTLSFTTLPATVVYGTAPLPLSATGGASGNAVLFSVASGPAVVTGNSLAITGAGTVVVAANQAGNSDYMDAPVVTQTIAVTQARLTVAIVGNPTKTYDSTTAATLTSANYQVGGLAGTDSFTVTQTAGTYASAAAGVEGITVTLAPANFQAASGSLANYVLPVSASGTGMINTALATVTPNAGTKIYGTSDPALIGTLLGFVAADNITSSYSRTPGETVLGGPYTIKGTLSPAAALANYTITYNTASFTITPAAASVTPSAANKIYGTTDPAFTGGLTGFLPADGVAAAYTRNAGETVVGSPYTISATLSPAAVLSNYAITSNTATFTINPALASVTPAANGKTYGNSDPTLAGTLAGFLPADGVTAAYTRVAGATVGTYTISAALSPASVLSNYTITSNTATFTINPALASVTPAANGKTYGTTDPTLTGTLTGFVPADGVSAVYTRQAGQTVGSYSIAAALSPAAVLSNYTITYNTATFTINTALASVTPSALSKIYGTADPALTGTLIGFVAGDGVTANYARTTGSTVGAYTVSAVLSPAAVLSNYSITYNTAAFTINPALATVTPNAATKVYGTTDPAFTGTLTGFVPADSVMAVYTRTAGQGVGGYTISAALSPAAVLSNYTIHYNNAAFSITPAILTVTALNSTQVYGATPVLASATTGYVNGDTSTAVSGVPALATTANTASLPGTYPITIGIGTLTAPNYTFNLIGAIDTVTFTGTAPGRNGLCNGAYSGTYYGNLFVVPGEVCIFVNGGVTGNIQQIGGTVELITAKVGGNYQVNGGGNFSVTDGSVVGGNLQIQQLPFGLFQHPPCWNGVHSDPNFDSDGGKSKADDDDPPSCDGNTFHGHPQQFNQDGFFTITDWRDFGGNWQNSQNPGNWWIPRGWPNPQSPGTWQNPGAWATNLVCGSTVNGDLQFQNNGTAVLIGAAAPASCPGNTVGGNLQVQNNIAPVSVVGNTVGNNLAVQNNTAATIVNSNKVKGNLQDQNNSAPTQVFNDAVSRNLICQGNSAITGGSDTAKMKLQQCSAF